MRIDRSFLIVSPLILVLTYASISHAGLFDSLGANKQVIPRQSYKDSEIASGLKEALRVGSGKAVAIVSQINGYYENETIKIPLPNHLRSIRTILVATGLESRVEAFEKSMNRAAEKAAPQAKKLFWNAVKAMTISDARKILKGNDDAATQYLKKQSSAQLSRLFRPSVHNAMSAVDVTRKYQDLTASMKSVPLLGNHSFDLDQYVTDKALEGLFYMLAQEEKNIRNNPSARVSPILKKIFSVTRE